MITPDERAAIERIREDLQTWISFDGVRRLEIMPGRQDIVTLMAVIDREYPNENIQ